MMSSRTPATVHDFAGGLRQVLLCALVGVAETVTLMLALLFATGLLAW